MISSQYASRVSLRRDRVDSFDRYPFSLPAVRSLDNLNAEPGFGPSVASSYGVRSLHEQSHGESFLALMTERFGGQGLYLLDEPEAALSPQQQLTVLSRIHDLVLKDSQFIIATHSPILMAYPDAWIQVTRGFLDNPERMLRIFWSVE